MEDTIAAGRMLTIRKSYVLLPMLPKLPSSIRSLSFAEAALRTSAGVVAIQALTGGAVTRNLRLRRLSTSEAYGGMELEEWRRLQLNLPSKFGSGSLVMA
jgi:hypothetical protein